MAEKKEKKGGGCLVQILLGFLAGVALLLALAFFLSEGPIDDEGDSLADRAVPAAEAPVEPAPLPKAPEDKPVAPPQHDAGLDPSSDDQIAEDAAAAGMTSRTPSTPTE